MKLQEILKKIKNREHAFLHTKNDVLRINTMYNSENELLGYEICLRITLQCNLNCRYCFIPKRIGVKERWIELLINYLKDINLEGSTIILTGGEPTLYPKFSEILDKLQPTGAHIVTQTNAVLFSDNTLLNKLNAKKHCFFISFPSGVEREYNYITNSNLYKDMAEGVKKLSHRHMVTLNYVIYKQNYQSLGKTLEVIANNFDLSNINLVISNLVLGGNLTLDQVLIKYTYLMNEIEEPISAFKKKFNIGFTVSGGCSFPLCMLQRVVDFKEEIFFETQEGNIDVDNFDKQFYKNKKCFSCKYTQYCQGFPTEYIKKFGDSEIEPITD